MFHEEKMRTTVWTAIKIVIFLEVALQQHSVSRIHVSARLLLKSADEAYLSPTSFTFDF